MYGPDDQTLSKKMIERAKLTYDELVAAVTEVEAINNSRPLSYILLDDMDEPFTPAHLFVGHRLLSLLDGLIRSVSLDCPENENEPNGPSEIPTWDETVDKPKRATAIKARDQFKAIALCEQEDELLD